MDEKPANPAIMKFFECGHLPKNLKEISFPFKLLAQNMVDNLPCGAERSAGLRKLLEAKDCMVRAAL